MGKRVYPTYLTSSKIKTRLALFPESERHCKEKDIVRLLIEQVVEVFIEIKITIRTRPVPGLRPNKVDGRSWRGLPTNYHIR